VLGAFLVGGLVLSVVVTANALLMATVRTIQAPCFSLDCPGTSGFDRLPPRSALEAGSSQCNNPVAEKN
jgi:hypothetical protein